MTYEQRKDMYALKMKLYAIHEEIRNKYLITNQVWSTPFGPELSPEEVKQLWEVIKIFIPARDILNTLGLSAEDKMWSQMADMNDRHNAKWDEAFTRFEASNEDTED
ncbi:hypothetical protein GCM10028805_52250 [Spirosoma harenae]